MVAALIYQDADAFRGVPVSPPQTGTVPADPPRTAHQGMFASPSAVGSGFGNMADTPRKKAVMKAKETVLARHLFPYV
jgi:hypothetical protein